MSWAFEVVNRWFKNPESLIQSLKILFNSKYVEYIQENKAKSIFLGCIGLLLIRYPYIKIKRKLLHYPPGPVGLPFIGNLHSRLLSIKYDDGNFYNKLPPSYGPICIQRSGSLPMVVISHSKLVKQLFDERQIVDRIPIEPHFYSISATRHGKGERPLVFINGKSWIHRRKLARAVKFYYIYSFCLCMLFVCFVYFFFFWLLCKDRSDRSCMRTRDKRFFIIIIIFILLFFFFLLLVLVLLFLWFV